MAEHPDICQADPALGRVLGNNLLGNLERLHWKHINITENMTQEEACIFPFVESLTDQLYLTLKLLMKRHVFVYSPYEIIFSAKELMDVMHKATIEDRLATPLDIHSLALAAMTLLESTINPVFAGECWESLKKLDEILEYRHARSSSAREFDGILSTPGWDYKLRVFVEWRRSQAQTSHHNSADVAGAGAGAGATVAGPAPVGPNEQRSLQHLADLAVGAEDTVGANASPPPPENGMDSSPKPPNRHSPYDGMVVDYTFLTHRGYLSVLSGVAFPRHPRPSST